MSIEHTARTGADKGYYMFVPEDGCSTMNADWHNASINYALQNVSTVTDCKSVAAALASELSGKPVSPDVEQGYLVLADVSGYTGFLAGTELEHATGILAELIQEMLDGLSPPLELAAVEGDAVFVHGPADVVARGETLLELIEATYAGFRMRRDVMAARTTCGCGACSRIDDARPQVRHPLRRLRLAGRRRPRTPVGTDVNVVHRLLKNGIEAETGWRGYALFTDAALSRLGIEATGMHRRVEEYEHLGGVDTASARPRRADGVPPGGGGSDRSRRRTGSQSSTSPQRPQLSGSG